MLTLSYPNSSYQVGGSLPYNAPTYVDRQADEALFQGLLKGEFCYVFNSRQMGKSSLRVKTTHRLQAEGIRCGVIDISAIGTQEITPEQWYASILGLLTKTFKLQVHLLRWWKERSHLSLVNRVNDFLESILLPQIQEKIVIFIDEIDSVLSLNFSCDDFFALIRACYNRRAEQPDYHRLTFALFGVATPSDLISDATRTPFNIGKPIELKGFQLSEATPLLSGLTKISQPQTVLKRILYWTGGQPFLTQKLCKLVAEAAHHQTLVPSSLDDLVETHIINNWESQDEPEHLKTIRDRLLYREEKAGQLLGLYQKILLNLSTETKEKGEWVGIPLDNSLEQAELILTGLVEKVQGILRIKNPIYQQIFNSDWVTQQLANLRPYSQSINAWVLSKYQDESRLLQGKALQDILTWSQGKSLSPVDYQFFAASQDLDAYEIRKTLEAEKLKEVETRLELERQRSLEQRQNLKRQRLLLGIVSLMMLTAVGLGLFANHQYQQAAISEVKAILLSSEALFASHKHFDALLQAIKAKERLKEIRKTDPDLKTNINAALWQVIVSIQESNRLNGHRAAVMAVDISPNGQEIATASVDHSIKLWKRDGTLIRTLTGHDAVVRAVKFSPDGEIIASAGDNKSIKLWTRDGTLLQTLQANASGVWGVDFSPDGQTFVTAGSDSVVELWDRNGQLLTRFGETKTGVRSVTFSPDGQTIAAATINNTVELWKIENNSKPYLLQHNAPVYAVAFSPDNTLIVSGCIDGGIWIWSREGKLLKTLDAHKASVIDLKFSPDSTFFASGSWDKTIKLWKQDGTEKGSLKGHDSSIWGIAFSPDGEEIISAGAENIAIIWKTANLFQKRLYGFSGLIFGLGFNQDGTIIATSGTDKTIQLRQLDGTLLRTINSHEAALGHIAFNPEGNMIASVSEDRTLRLWQLDGTLIRTFTGHSATLISVGWSPDGETIAVGGADGRVWLWKRDGRLIKILEDHTASVWNLAFSPDGKILATASNDSTIRLWNKDGQQLKILDDHEAPVWRVAFSPDSQILVSGSGDMTVKLWTKEGILLKTLTGHKAAIWGIAFSPDGSLIATSSIDQTVKIWTKQGKLLTTLTGHTSGVRAVAFHPKLPVLASASDDQSIILWNLDKILDIDSFSSACNWVKNYLNTNIVLESDQVKLCRR